MIARNKEVSGINNVGILTPVEVNVMHMRTEVWMILAHKNIAKAKVAYRVTLGAVTRYFTPKRGCYVTLTVIKSPYAV